MIPEIVSLAEMDGRGLRKIRQKLSRSIEIEIAEHSNSKTWHQYFVQFLRLLRTDPFEHD